jgi:N-acetyl-1-D-myo-inositol-2-amino-2-deoxy-alpha-D-glucopyranoside deacetylase
MDRRLLLVHAHPDDESIGTGATMARYAAEGAEVTLVTCTRGELGEVIPPELAYLATGGDPLGEYRIAELAAACAALGIGDQRFLGGPGRWRDSGMMGLPANDSPDCFWQADLATAAAELAEVILDVRPQVLVTYDENGFYGHPDHIQAHRVARAAIGLAAGPGQARPWQVAKFYATAMPRSVAVATGVDYFVPFVPDEQVTTEIDGSAYLAAKTAAMRAHATQIVVDGDRFALSSGRWQPLLAREYYTLLAWGSDPPGTPRGADGAWPASRQAPSREMAGPSGAAHGTREHDLFAGLDGR